MGEKILYTHNLTKVYNKNIVVDHVNMDIEKGDIYGFIGENGAGKTTFMRMVCGLVKPTSGQIELFGKADKREIEKTRRDIGSIIEQPAIYPNLSAIDNLEAHRRYLTVSMVEKEENDLLQLVGLEGVENKPVGKFSLGMKQRLGIALALVGNPKFLILDEPTIGLDPVGVVELRSLLKKLNQDNNITILLSSHNLVEMGNLATKFGILHKGKLLSEITSEEMDKECEKYSGNMEEYVINLIMGDSVRGVNNG